MGGPGCGPGLVGCRMDAADISTVQVQTQFVSVQVVAKAVSVQAQFVSVHFLSALPALLHRGPLVVHMLRWLGCPVLAQGSSVASGVCCLQPSSLAGWYGVTQLCGSIPVDNRLSKVCHSLPRMWKGSCMVSYGSARHFD